MPTISAPSYAKELITKQYQITNNSLDLNMNGKIEVNEKVIDINNNGVIGDNADFINFLDRNSLQIRKDISFIDYGKGLKSSNIIHDLLNIEAEMVKPEETKLAYEKLTKLINTIKKELSLEKNKGLSLTHQALLALNLIWQSGFKKVDSADNIFTKNLVNGVIDFNSSTNILLAVADELGWDRNKLGIYPNHLFLAVGAKNIDFNKAYFDNLKIEPDSIKGESLSNEQIKLLWIFFRGEEKYKLGDYKGAIVDYTKALSLKMKEFHVLTNIGMAKHKLGDNLGALVDFNKAIELNPKYIFAYYHRGIVKGVLGDFDGSISDLNIFILNNQTVAKAYLYRALSKRASSRDLQGSVSDLDKAILLEPTNYESYYMRGVGRYLIDDTRGAIQDLNIAIANKVEQMDEAFWQRGTAKMKLEDFEGAITDLTLAVKINNKNEKFAMFLGVAKYMSGDIDGGTAELYKAISLGSKEAAVVLKRLQDGK